MNKQTMNVEQKVNLGMNRTLRNWMWGCWVNANERARASVFVEGMVSAGEILEAKGKYLSLWVLSAAAGFRTGSRQQLETVF
jgi:hypothetical protein